MRSVNEKLEFSQRLKQAMGNSRKKIQTPTELADAFNLRYHGRSISPQAAHRWLMGTAVPTLDKVETLAEMFKVPVQWLRLGIPGGTRISTKNANKETQKQVTPTAEELLLLMRLRMMSEHRRSLILALISDIALEQEAWRE